MENFITELGWHSSADYAVSYSSAAARVHSHPFLLPIQQGFPSPSYLCELHYLPILQRSWAKVCDIGLSGRQDL